MKISLKKFFSFIKFTFAQTKKSLQLWIKMVNVTSKYCLRFPLIKKAKQLDEEHTKFSYTDR